MATKMNQLTARIPNRHGLNIAVLVEIPANPKGLVFIVHGWTSSRNSSSAVAFAETTLQHNMIAVRFDCTHSSGESDGSIELSTISTFVDDLDAVVQWAKTQPWFQTPYILAGNSLGGITILEHTHKHKNEVCAIALIATVVSGELSVQARLRKDPEAMARWQAAGIQHQTYTAGSADFPWTHMEDRLNHDALVYASELTMPVLMCVGSEDDSCPPDHQRLLYDALGSNDKELHIIDGAPHSYKDPAHVAVLKSHIYEWFVKIG